MQNKEEKIGKEKECEAMIQKKGERDLCICSHVVNRIYTHALWGLGAPHDGIIQPGICADHLEAAETAPQGLLLASSYGRGGICVQSMQI